MPLCPNCICDSCRPHNERRAAIDARIAERVAAAKEKRDADLANRRRLRELVLREACMIWLLINAGVSDEQLAIDMDKSLTHVRHRRRAYVFELDSRTKRLGTRETDDRSLRRLQALRAVGDDSFSESWAKYPGSRGTELPEWCETCGGMFTAGRWCLRCAMRASTRRLSG